MNDEKIKKEVSFLTKIFWIMFFGSGAFLVILVYVVSNRPLVVRTEEVQVFLPLAVVLCMVSGLGSLFIPKKLLKAMKTPKEDEARLSQYRKAVMIRLGLIEFAVFLCCAFFYATGAKDFSYLALAMLLLLRIQKPSEYKLKNDLDLEENEE